jgi:hypothetical protein
MLTGSRIEALRPYSGSWCAIDYNPMTNINDRSCEIVKIKSAKLTVIFTKIGIDIYSKVTNLKGF